MSAEGFSGRCLCGAVTYTCDTEPALTAVCHCEDCQRGSGSTFSVNVVVARDDLHLEGDTLRHFVTVGEDTEAQRERMFCSTCGSPVVTVMADAPDMAVIKAGTLDDRSWLAPEAELWCDSAQPWLASGEERGRFPRGLPT